MTNPRVATSTRCLFAAVLASSCTPLVEATPADDGSSGSAVTTQADTNAPTTAASTGQSADSTTGVPPGTTTGGTGSTSSSGTTAGPLDSGTSDSGTTAPGTSGPGTTDSGTTDSGTTGTGTSGTTGPGGSGTSGSGTTDSGTAGSSSGATGTAGDACAAGSAQTLTITPNGIADYVINGANDPALTVVRGCTYTFDLNAPGHPFYIKTVSSTGTGNAYNDGVSGNGTTVGSFTWDVQSNAPDNLFYNCATHAGMAGTITVID